MGTSFSCCPRCGEFAEYFSNEDCGNPEFQISGHSLVQCRKCGTAVLIQRKNDLSDSKHEPIGNIIFECLFGLAFGGAGAGILIVWALQWGGDSIGVELALQLLIPAVFFALGIRMVGKGMRRLLRIWKSRHRI